MAYLLSFVIALGLAILGIYFNGLFAATSAKSIIFSFAVPPFYIFAGYMFRPEPDMNDIGWFGGLVDNPFSWSDDTNRGLLYLKLALMPGLLLALPFVAMFKDLQDSD